MVVFHGYKIIITGVLLEMKVINMKNIVKVVLLIVQLVYGVTIKKNFFV